MLTGLLASCGGGGGTVNNPFKPTRVIIFGDSFSFVSSTAAYTVNDNSLNNWARQIASSYGVTNVVNNAAANALVSDVQTQVNTFGSNYQAADLVVISAGYRDIINNAVSGGGSTTTATTNGQSYASLVRTLVSNGAKRIAVANVYDLSKAPAAGLQTNLASQNANNRGALVAAFNDALKSNLGSSTLTYIGDNVRLLDTEAYLNLVRAAPGSYSFVDTTTVTCTVQGAGVGLGNNRVDSSQCTAANATGGTATTYTTPAYNNYVFADSVYPTPAFHRSWGINAYNQLVARW
jgi:phospholipase/lecithinase/hemolysin